mmetsp:Transcript_1087/g.1351  ORF Transcript_1087/g.1351 Transcript_1087/m.1351 type:complete len:135 (-) Transcript_1087:315-719(-)
MLRYLSIVVLTTAVSAFTPGVTYSPSVIRRVAPLQMANNAGAEKRIKISERDRVKNAAWRSRVRTWTRKTSEAIDEGDVVAAKECARVATSMIDRATRRKIYHKNWAARNKSRLSKKVIALILEKRGETEKTTA